jgi:hypothetical protein
VVFHRDKPDVVDAEEASISVGYFRFPVTIDNAICLVPVCKREKGVFNIKEPREPVSVYESVSEVFTTFVL